MASGYTGRREAALGSLDAVFADMQARKERENAMRMSQQDRDQAIRAQLLAAYMQNPTARTHEAVRSAGVQLPDFQLTPQEQAELEAAIAKADAQKGLATNATNFNPFLRDQASYAFVTGNNANADATKIEAARNFMPPDTFAAHVAGGFLPSSEVEKNKAAAFKDTTEGQFNQGPRVRVADANVRQSDASASASRASAIESGTRLGLIKEQTTNEALRRDPKSPVSPGYVKPAQQPAASSGSSQAAMASDAIAAIDDFLTSSGYSSAVGAKGASSGFGLMKTPMAGTDAAASRAKYERVKANLTLPNLEKMRGLGPMSDREFATLGASAAADIINMPEEDAAVELMRARRVLVNKKNGRVSTDADPLDEPTAQMFVKLAGGDKNKARTLAKRAGYSF